MNYKDLFKPVSFEEMLEKHKKPIEDKIREEKKNDL